MLNDDIIILRYGELSLKSTYVRRYFETTLVRNIKNAFAREHIAVDVRTERGRIYCSTPEISRSMNVLSRIFGIVSFSPAVSVSSTLPEISSVAQQVTKNVLDSHKSFAIRVTRVGTHSFTSQDVAVQIGKSVENATHARVDLTNPDFELFIEIREKNAFLFTEKIKGTGGLPLGTQGTVATLIKTPCSLLAAWYLMRRGCRIIFVMTDESTKESIHAFLSRWYTDAELFLIDQKREDFYQLLSTIVSENHCDGLATDHTFEAPTQAVSDLAVLKKNSVVPILTPLLTMTHVEIENQCTERGILP